MVWPGWRDGRVGGLGAVAWDGQGGAARRARTGDLDAVAWMRCAGRAGWCGPAARDGRATGRARGVAVGQATGVLVSATATPYARPITVSSRAAQAANAVGA
ncbi:hypothetical protein GCM10027161_60210 [Microbispora hainanensis]